MIKYIPTCFGTSFKKGNIITVFEVPRSPLFPFSWDWIFQVRFSF